MMSDTPQGPAAQSVLAYHARTCHHFQSYARGPEALDWEAQPAPFRHFAGAPIRVLPRFSENADPAVQQALGRPFRALGAPPAQPVALNAASLAVFLQLSLGVTAWKRFGPDRWAVRANPSSGNLHPLEAYLVVEGVPGLEDGVHHFQPEDHCLALRAAVPAPAPGAGRVMIGLSSVMWREAWKYGERAFRYCQLDTGHGMAALGVAARALGWRLDEVRVWGHGEVARLLGLDRPQDFPAGRRPEVEREEPEAVLLLTPGGGSPDPVDIHWPRRAGAAEWRGQASVIDPCPIHRWPVVDEVAALTRRGGAWAAASPVRSAEGAWAGDGSLGQVILGRRSAQRFDPARILSNDEFLALLGATLATSQAPWAGLVAADRVNLIVFLHRVDGWVPGIYFLERVKGSGAAFLKGLSPELRPRPMAAGSSLALWQLGEAEPVALRRLARSLHCHQDIAATACLALGMVFPLDHTLAADPAAYRDVHREAGVVGQMLYLQAEALGLRGTGIGCFFDDPVMASLGMEGGAYRTLYHFTVGAALEDSRIETLPA